MINKENINLEFTKIVNEQDAQGVWNFIESATRSLTQEETINYYSKLLQYEWHSAHDSIVSSLQYFSNPNTIDILYQTALNEDVDIMDYRPIARRCTWALADIGSQEAKDKLLLLSKCDNEEIRGYAQKRITNWDQEKYRKGFKFRLTKANSYLYLDQYDKLESIIENKSKQIITGHQTQDSIIVYQAFNPKIADYAIAHQKFGGTNYSFTRMTWIKPNFLWMMYRSGWATKDNQERILAISLPKAFFLKLLSAGELSSYRQSHYKEESTWKDMLATSEVRIQWDPHHRPDESKLDRKAIQIGIKGGLLEELNNHIDYIEDITPFVAEQRKYLVQKNYKYLKVPIETEFSIIDQDILSKLSISES